MQGMLAYIYPVQQGPVDPGFGAPPGWGLHPSQGPGFPTHPIAPGGPGWSGDPGYGAPPGWGLHPSQGPGFPTHPIAPGGQPPGFWGGVAPPWVSTGPVPPQPSAGWPPVAMPPIYFPPNKPGDPPTIWPSPGHPSHPIVLPPDPPPTIWPTPPGKPPGGETGSISNPINLPPAGAGGTQPGFWALTYFQELSGWVWVWVPVPTPPANVGGQPPVAQPKK